MRTIERGETSKNTYNILKDQSFRSAAGQFGPAALLANRKDRTAVRYVDQFQHVILFEGRWPIRTDVVHLFEVE